MNITLEQVYYDHVIGLFYNFNASWMDRTRL